MPRRYQVVIKSQVTIDVDEIPMTLLALNQANVDLLAHAVENETFANVAALLDGSPWRLKHSHDLFDVDAEMSVVEIVQQP